MKQYLELAEAVKTRGTYKPPAREGMPGTISLFGYQFRHDLSEGFPLLTTKKLSFKNIIVELLWFLSGDTNVKYLNDNGCEIWNEDAYNYLGKQTPTGSPIPTFEWFVDLIKSGNDKLGDCGEQYGALWRRWKTGKTVVVGHNGHHNEYGEEVIDQLLELIKGLKTSPMGRRHIITAWNPATLNDMALNACHALVQFNCRPLTDEEKHEWALKQPSSLLYRTNPETGFTEVNEEIIPKYYLDCQMYQRSADLFLGVPYNIASYALLTHILCKICNMVPGDYVHTFGDVHIYDNHMDQVNEQLTREPKALPTLEIDNAGSYNFQDDDVDFLISCLYNNVQKHKGHWKELFKLNNYDPHPAIKGELSTGLKK